MGACRRDELYKMKITDYKNLDSAVLIRIPNTKTKLVRKFTITDIFCDIFKKYASLRPSKLEQNYFFLNYQKGKCTVQRVGINKIGSAGTRIAAYLKLPNPELYTGHCFRRSSATILVDTGEDMTSLKRNRRWKSTSFRESYIEEEFSDSMLNYENFQSNTEPDYVKIEENDGNTETSIQCEDITSVKRHNNWKSTNIAENYMDDNITDYMFNYENLPSTSAPNIIKIEDNHDDVETPIQYPDATQSTSQENPPLPLTRQGMSETSNPTHVSRTMTDIFALNSEIENLNRLVSIPELTRAVRDLNNKLRECQSNLDIFTTYNDFVSNLNQYKFRN